MQTRRPGDVYRGGCIVSAEESGHGPCPALPCPALADEMCSVRMARKLWSRALAGMVGGGEGVRGVVAVLVEGEAGRSAARGRRR